MYVLLVLLRMYFEIYFKDPLKDGFVFDVARILHGCPLCENLLCIGDEKCLFLRKSWKDIFSIQAVGVYFGLGFFLGLFFCVCELQFKLYDLQVGLNDQGNTGRGI